MNTKLNSILFASLFFFACADESPTSSINDSISEQEQQKEREYERQAEQKKQQQENDCYYGTSSYSDSWCCTNFGYQCKQSSSSKKSSSSSYTNYYSSSSKKLSSSSYRSNYSSSSTKNTSNSTTYITTSKTIKLTLTYFKQTTPDWDNVLSLGTYTDADPRISFKIEFRDYNGKKTTHTTKNLLEKQDTGLWSGQIDYTTTVPAYTDTLYIYPQIIDADVLDNDNYSSGYGYGYYHIGKLANYEVRYESDYENKKCTLKWEWFLY